MLIQGPDGVTYAPLGYYPPQVSANRTSPTRTRSATLQSQRGVPPQSLGPASRYFSEGAPPAIGHGSNRHFSDGAAARPASSSSAGSRRPLPDEQDWVPSGSSRRNSQHVDPFEYQLHSDVPPIPQQYMQQSQGRRNYSGPSDVAYFSVRRSLPAGYSVVANQAHRTPSDPSMRRRSSRRDVRDELGDSHSEGEEDEDESNDSDLGNGAQVHVEPEPEPAKEKPPSRKPVGGRKKGKR